MTKFYVCFEVRKENSVAKPNAIVNAPSSDIAINLAETKLKRENRHWHDYTWSLSAIKEQ